jgi:hypothetical protein
MRLTRTTILAGGAALLVAGTAAAAAEKLHTMNVALPDGSVAQIQYVGDVAPRVAVEQADPRTMVAIDLFAQLDQIAAAMEAQHRAMIQQMAALQQAAADGAKGAPGQTLVAQVPAGVHYSYYSSTTDANGCTQTVQYSSDGSGAAPKVTQASAGNCDAAKPAGPVPASAPAKAPAETPTLDSKDV